jgi:hypothetical protein
MRSIRFGALALVLALAWTTAAAKSARAPEPIVPSWIHADAAAKNAVIEVEAGWNVNNGTLNFNGYANGEIRIVVPVAWHITMKLHNADLTLAHSMVITKPFAKGEFPNEARPQDAAIRRAYTSNPTGGIFNGSDEFDFTAVEKTIGEYYLFCGVTTHGVAGMWVHFAVRADATAPYIQILTPPAKPGRP